MSNIKSLANQTLWYGVSSIAARFINYLLTPFLTYSAAVSTADFGDMGLIYSALPLLNVLFTYGFETAYFRFCGQEEYKKDVYNTAALSLIVSTVFFTALLWLLQNPFAVIVKQQNNLSIVQLSILIIAFDSLSVIPFAKLRQEGKPRLFAFIKVGGILINIFFTWFFLNYCPNYLSTHPKNFLVLIYHPNISPIIYVLLANLIQAVFTLFLLSPQLSKISFKFNTQLWVKMMQYALPLIIVGMGGMINETFDRLMMGWWFPAAEPQVKSEVGIYNACYKLSILITLFIQAFRMGAEPFFFKQAQQEALAADPELEKIRVRRTYAKVMKFFVITICIIFLVVALQMPIWKRFIGPKYWAGLRVVPILLFANMFLGIYYNLSAWYKLANKTLAGAAITIFGVAVTCIINYIFIPTYSYMACAWATFFCYFSMMVVSFIWGQKVYRIPYAWKKLVAYLVIVFLLFGIHNLLQLISQNAIYTSITGALLTFGFIKFLFLVEQKDFKKLPFIGKYV